MVVPQKLDDLINTIKGKTHSDEEWFSLEKEVEKYIKVLPRELQDYFVDSGAGEMLGMICSGIKYDKALRSYGVEMDDDGRFLSWGELEEGETLEEDPETGEYRRRAKK